MGSEGAELAADCVDLWKASEYELRPLAAHYRQVSDLILSAESGMTHLWRHESLGGSFGPVRDVWDRVADVAVQALRETADNLDATADVLNMASEEYRITDAVAAKRSSKGFRPPQLPDRSGGGEPSMTYALLAEHSVEFEELAIHASLRAQGFRQVGNGWDPPFGTEDGADLVMEATYRRFTGVAQLFTPFFGLPDPNDLRELSMNLERAQGKLSTGEGGYMDPATRRMVIEDPVMNGMSAVGASLQDWRGAAAEQFKDKFMKPWPAITANQFTLLAVLDGAIKAEISLWTEARKNVDDIAHMAISALQSTGGIDDPKVEVFALTVASSVFSIGAAVVATTAAGASLALTVASGAAQAAGATPREDAPKVAIDGGTAHEIVEQTHDALNTLAAKIHQKETEIAYGMAMCLVTVVNNKDMFTAPRPWLADHTASTITTDDGLGENL